MTHEADELVLQLDEVRTYIEMVTELAKRLEKLESIQHITAYPKEGAMTPDERKMYETLVARLTEAEAHVRVARSTLRGVAEHLEQVCEGAREQEERLSVAVESPP